MDDSLPSFDSVFCDWLDVTFSPEAFDYDEFYFAFTQIYPDVTEGHSRNDGTRVIVVGYGSLHLSFKKSFIRVSASGGVLSVLRSSGRYMDFLGLLTDYPHRVTRIDVSMDRSVAAPRVISDLWGRYKDGLTLGQRPLATNRIVARDDLKRSTGTFTAGYRSKATRTLKVYDKRWEVMCKHGCPIPDRVRYEFTMKGGKSKTHAQPSLRDALEPTALFWDMAKDVLKVPKNTPLWSDTSMTPWTYEKPAGLTTWERFCGLLETSPDITRLLSYAHELGEPGLKLLVSKLTAAVAQSDSRIG
jgi:hypothetical protein